MAQLKQIFKAIRCERKKQADKWNRSHDWGYGDCSSGLVERMTKVAVLTEEVGEVARAVLENKSADNEELREELVQVAAVAVAWLEHEGINDEL